MIWANWQRAIARGAALTLLLWSGLAWTQTPAQPARADATERIMVVNENGKKTRCKVLETWELPDKRVANLLQALETGEKITIVDEHAPGSNGGLAGLGGIPKRIFAWGIGKLTSPEGAPSLPRRDLLNLLTKSDPPITPVPMIVNRPSANKAGSIPYATTPTPSAPKGNTLSFPKLFGKPEQPKSDPRVVDFASRPIAKKNDPPRVDLATQPSARPQSIAPPNPPGISLKPMPANQKPCCVSLKPCDTCDPGVANRAPAFPRLKAMMTKFSLDVRPSLNPKPGVLADLMAPTWLPIGGKPKHETTPAAPSKWHLARIFGHGTKPSTPTTPEAAPIPGTIAQASTPTAPYPPGIQPNPRTFGPIAPPAPPSTANLSPSVQANRTNQPAAPSKWHLARIFGPETKSSNPTTPNLSRFDPMKPTGQSESPVSPPGITSITTQNVTPTPLTNPTASTINPSTANASAQPAAYPQADASAKKSWQPGDRLQAWFKPGADTAKKNDAAPAKPSDVQPKPLAQSSDVDRSMKDYDILTQQNAAAQKVLEQRIAQIYKKPFSTAMANTPLPNAPRPETKTPAAAPLAIPAGRSTEEKTAIIPFSTAMANTPLPNTPPPETKTPAAAPLAIPAGRSPEEKTAILPPPLANRDSLKPNPSTFGPITLPAQPSTANANPSVQTNQANQPAAPSKWHLGRIFGAGTKSSNPTTPNVRRFDPMNSNGQSESPVTPPGITSIITQNVTPTPMTSPTASTVNPSTANASAQPAAHSHADASAKKPWQPGDKLQAWFKPGADTAKKNDAAPAKPSDVLPKPLAKISDVDRSKKDNDVLTQRYVAAQKVLEQRIAQHDKTSLPNTPRPETKTPAASPLAIPAGMSTEERTAILPPPTPPSTANASPSVQANQSNQPAAQSTWHLARIFGAGTKPSYPTTPNVAPNSGVIAQRNPLNIANPPRIQAAGPSQAPNVSRFDPMNPTGQPESPVSPPGITSITTQNVTPTPLINSTASTVNPSTANASVQPAAHPQADASAKKPWQPGDRLQTWFKPGADTAKKNDVASNSFAKSSTVDRFKKGDDILTQQNVAAQKVIEQRIAQLDKPPFSTAMPTTPLLNAPPLREMGSHGPITPIDTSDRSVLDQVIRPVDFAKTPAPVERRNDPLLNPERLTPVSAKVPVVLPAEQRPPAEPPTKLKPEELKSGPPSRDPSWPLNAQSVLASHSGLQGPVVYFPVPVVTIPQPNHPPMPPAPVLPTPPQHNNYVNAFSPPPPPKSAQPNPASQGMSGAFANPMMTQQFMQQQMMQQQQQMLAQQQMMAMSNPAMPYMAPANPMMAQGMPYGAPMPAVGPLPNYGRQYPGPLPPNPMMQAGYTQMPYPPMVSGYGMMPQQPLQQANYQQPMRQPSAAQQLDQVLRVLRESPYPNQREWATQALAYFDWRSHPQVVPALLQAASQDRAGNVRAGSVSCLGRIGAAVEPVIGTLHTLRNDIDPRVRQEVVQAFIRLGQTPMMPQ